MDHKKKAKDDLKKGQKMGINSFLVLRIWQKNWQQKLACLDATQFSKAKFLKTAKKTRGIQTGP
jgi:hypothetical protein